MDFSNLQVSAEQLPKAEEVQLTPIDTRYFRVLVYQKLIYWVILLIGMVLAAIFLGKPGNLLSLTAAISCLIILVFADFRISYLSFLNKKFAVRQHDIIYQNGWLIKKLHIFPFNRIQHCSVNSGYFERKFSLSSLKLYTAGGSDSDISIPGLTDDQASRLRELVIEKNRAE